MTTPVFDDETDEHSTDANAALRQHRMRIVAALNKPLQDRFAKEADDAAALEKLLQEPWSPPDHLTKNVLLELREKPVFWLSEAINLMAFGKIEQIGARRYQAARALLGDPARNEEVSFIGGTKIGSDRSDTISPRYFDVPRTLGDTNNSISRDFHVALGIGVSDDEFNLSNEEFCALFDGQDERWFNVRTVGPSFVVWLGRQIGLPEEALVSEATHNPVDSEECRRLLDDEPQPKKQGTENYRPAIAYRALKKAFPSRVMPEGWSITRLVKKAKDNSPSPKCINADAVKRALTKK
jgi:hypothetical protein